VTESSDHTPVPRTPTGALRTPTDPPDPATPAVPPPGGVGAGGDGDRRPRFADDLVTTSHRLTTDDGAFTYTATAGRIVVREEVHDDGAFHGPRAKIEMFVVSYRRDDIEDPARRPVTFAFNGGPGAPSVWLHLGLLGPRRVMMGDAGELLPPPYGIAPNPQSLLAHTDLVFIDPVSTGYSRVATGEKPADYHGYQPDIEAIGELIRLWVSRNGRWMSPKFIAGESYGTIRGTALAAYLQRRYGLFLNGLILISPILDYATIRFTEGNDLPYPMFLPTYAALAHFHGAGAGGDLADVRAAAEHFAGRDYPYALAMGSRLPEAERAATVHRLAELTGLAPDYLERADLRVEHHRFLRELLRRRGLVVGRLDGRFTGHDADDAADVPEHDPSQVAVLAPYAAAINHYLHHELGYRSDLPYEVDFTRSRPWSYAEFENRHVAVTDSLSQVMRHNPHIKVHVACGYYDVATPYFGTHHTLSHTVVPNALRGNIEIHHYDAGHMMYVHEPSRLTQSADLAAFVRAAVPR
jgi:carboxypeptidase C (cathepsin A)